MKGKTIAHYEVGEKLGAGGMGVVYQATDTKLNREVALKVLPEEFARDSARMARFKREAQVLASLNHPNIAAIHGLEQEGDIQAIAMELVDGLTLAERIKQGAIPLDEALNIAKQIAEALESAHEQGVIHRDLKPANVKVKEDGTVKVLDFGLAKALEDPQSDPDMSNSPTLSVAATRAGIILGTAAYMSPEQARGQTVDKRADIWSFGVVLFEMLTGKRLFTGETTSDILARVLTADLDFDSLPTDTPPTIRKLLRRCLSKDRKQRLQAIGEARIGIVEVQVDPSGASVMMSGPSTLTGSKPQWQRALPWAVAGLMAIVAAVAFWAPWRSGDAQALKLETGFEFLNWSARGDAGPPYALSPDGKTLVYIGEKDNANLLYVRALDRLEATPLLGTEDAQSPFFSPDGRWVGFFDGSALKKVAVTGGTPLTLCSSGAIRGASWGLDDTIVFSMSTASGLSVISAAGGTPRPLTTLAEGERSHRWPQILPGGEAALFLTQRVGQSFDQGTIETVLLRTGERKVIFEGGLYPRYLDSGFLVFGRQGTLYAAPFDPQKLALKAQPIPVLEGVVTSDSGNGAAGYAFSADGRMIYEAGSGGEAIHGWNLTLVNRQGKSSLLMPEKGEYYDLRYAPDGKRIAINIFKNTNNLWVYDGERGTMSRLTFAAGGTFNPVWTPDGSRIIYDSAAPGGAPNLHWRRADGTGEAERLTTSPNPQAPTSISPDGKWLLFSEMSSSTQTDIMLLPMTGTRTPEVFLPTPNNEDYAEFSPDGRWVAYQSDESGRSEIYVRPFVQATGAPTATGQSAATGKWQISTTGGYSPRWTKSGRELIYRESPTRWMSVAVTAAGGAFQASTPKLALEFAPARTSRGNSFYDVTRDGLTFLLSLPPEEEPSGEGSKPKLIFVQNWFAEVRRLTATGE